MKVGPGNAGEYQEGEVNDITTTEGGFLASSHGNIVQIDHSGGYRGRVKIDGEVEKVCFCREMLVANVDDRAIIVWRS